MPNFRRCARHGCHAAQRLHQDNWIDVDFAEQGKHASAQTTQFISPTQEKGEPNMTQQLSDWTRNEVLSKVAWAKTRI